MMTYFDYAIRQIRRYKLLVSFACACLSPLFAQENIRFERLSVNEGLSQSDVKSMVQDKLGFLWIGTRDGLNVYDGYSFRVYNRKKGDSSSLAFNQILDLELDALGNIWIGSTGGISVYQYAQDEFRNFLLSDNALPSADIYHILLTRTNTILLSTSRGLISFDTKQQRFFSDPAFVQFSNYRVFHTYYSSEDGLWVATHNGVYIQSPGQTGWHKLLSGLGILHIEKDRNGLIYVCTTRGLYTYNPVEKKVSRVQLPMEFSVITDVQRINNGDLWVASNKIIVLDGYDRFQNILTHDEFDLHSLSEDRARVIYKTDDGAVWVGTFGYGLNKFNPSVTSFSYLSERTKLRLSGNYVSTIHTFNDSTLWIGTSRGLDVIDLVSKSAVHFTDDVDLFQILKIKSDTRKRIWASTSKGLMLYSKENLVLKDSLLTAVYDFDEWDSTHLILATRVNGIFLFNVETNKRHSFITPSGVGEEVSCLLVEGEHLWVGCNDGLRLYDRKGNLVRLFTLRENLAGDINSSFIKSIYRDSKKNLWIGTWGGGLGKFNVEDSTFITYTTNDGLRNNVVYGILEDSSGILWLSTNKGIVAFDPTKNSFRGFTFEVGLQSDEFNTGAYFKSSNDQLYFGGINGLSFFRPKEILRPCPAPTLLNTSILISNRELAFQPTDSLKNVKMIHRIQSGWKANDISLQFSAVDLMQGKAREFQYALTDTSWFDIGSRRSLELLDLPSGEHIVRVRTRIPGNPWNPYVDLLTIDIIPPLWQRTWFQALVAWSILVLAFAGYRLRIENLRKTNITLNNLVNERTKEIQVINEEILTQNEQLNAMNRELEAFSFSISHDLRSPLRSVIGYSQILEEDYQDRLDDEGKKILTNIRHKALKMDTLVNDLLQFSRMSRQQMQKVETDMLKLVNSILDETKQSLPEKTEIRLHYLPAVLADKNLITQVWTNLLSNAIKYSSKKNNPLIEIGSTETDNVITFYVCDNGAGFDMKYADKLFNVFQRLHKAAEFDGVGVGLALVHRIVDRHGGRVWAEGKVNEGATFYFTIPKDSKNPSRSK